MIINTGHHVVMLFSAARIVQARAPKKTTMAMILSGANIV